MVFKRRDRRPWWEILARFVYPRGGWGRAAEYMRHRLTRLPDSPERIARGVWAGVFVSFTPLFGLHFFLAAFVARIMRGNMLASLLATIFGNPITFVPIATVSLRLGNKILGNDPQHMQFRHLGSAVADVWLTIWRNFIALFTSDHANWAGLRPFFHDVFVPYLLGGIVPGVICATIVYYLSVPFIRVYQARRVHTLAARREKRRQRVMQRRDSSAK